MRTMRLLGVAAVVLALSTACQGGPKSAGGEAGPAGSPGPLPSSAPASPPPSATGSATPTATPTPPPPADTVYRLGPLGLGPLKLGMTKAQAEATGVVNPFVNEPNSDQCLWRTTVKHPSDRGATVFLSKTLGVATIDASGGVKTPEGIGLGSSLTDVKRAYAGFALSADLGRGYQRVPGNSNAVYRIAVDNATVTQLTLQYNNQDCYE